MEDGYRLLDDFRERFETGVVYENASIMFTDGTTERFEAVRESGDRLITGEIKKIEFPLRYVKERKIFSDLYKNEKETEDMFFEKGFIQTEYKGIVRINSENKRDIVLFDKINFDRPWKYVEQTGE